MKFLRVWLKQIGFSVVNRRGSEKAPMRLPLLLGISLLLTPLAARADLSPFQDTLFGNGSAGPYQLSWQHIPGQLVSISKGGQNLVLALDYTVDADSGNVSFTHPLAVGTVLVAKYQYDTGLSTHVPQSTSVPLSYNMTAAKQTNLFISGAFQNSDQPQADPLAHLNMGIKSAIQGVHGTSVSGQMLYSAGPTGQAGGADRSAASVDARTDAGRNLHLSMNWYRAGNNFDSSAASGLTPGASHLQLGANGALSKQVQASVAHTEDQSPGQTHTSDNLNVTAAPAKNLQIGATMTTQDEINKTASINAQAGVTKQISMSASASQTVQGDNSSNQQQVGVNLNPSDKVQLSTSVVTNKGNDTTTQAASVSATVKPVNAVRVDATFVDRSTDQDDTNASHFLDTTSATLTLSPVKALSVIGRYGQNVADGSGNAQPVLLRGLGLQSTLGCLTVQGGYDWSEATNTSLVSTQLSLGIGMRVCGTFLNAGYVQNVASASTPTAQTTQTYTVSLSHSVSDRVSLSVNGSLSQQAIQGSTQPAPNLTTSANIGVKF